MALDNPDFDAMLKVIYLDTQRLQHTMLEDNPLLGLMPKDEGNGGLYISQPMISVGNRKRSATYATARAGTQDTETVQFQVGTVNNYGFARWTDDVMKDSRGRGNKAVLEAVETEMDGALAHLRNDHGQGVYGNVGGSKGVVGSLSTVFLTLATPEDIIHFDIGDKLALSDDDGTGSGDALRDSGDVVTVIGIDSTTGIIEGDATWTTQITGAVAGDFIFFEGDFQNKASGLAGWIPDVSPLNDGSDSFHGVDRGPHPDRMAGYRFNAGGLLPEDIVTRMVARGSRINGHKPTHFFVNDEVWADYSSSMENKTEMQLNAVGGDGKKVASVGYEAIKIRTARGPVALVSDPNCPVNRGYLLDINTWKASSVGKLVEMISVAGSPVQRGTADDWFTELKSRWNISCKAPWQNGVAKLDVQAD